jgi:hypothetical protein
MRKMTGHSQPALAATKKGSNRGAYKRIAVI